MSVRSPFILVLSIFLGADARAQQSAPAPTPAPAAITSGFQDGFFVQSANGDYRLVLGMVAQTDGRFSVDDPQPITNTFTVRKLRPTLSGRVGRYFDFKVMPDFGNGTTVVQDAYFDIRFSPAFRLRTGKDKTPVGYELLQGDAFVLFPERALASSLVPNRDIGIQAQGELHGGKVFYAGGVFNGIPDGTSATTELDQNNDKDLAGRIVLQPFRVAAGTSAHAIAGLGVQVGGSHGTQNGALPAFKTSVGQTYFSYATGATARGDRTRVSPAVFYYYRSLGVFAELMHSSQDVVRGDVARQVTNHAWEATASYVLTGETASDRGVRPRNNFDPAAGYWGALQLLARYTELTVDRDVFTAGLAVPGASRTAQSWTVAANWYPNPAIKWYATFERTVFDDRPDGPRPAENIVLFRAQLAF
jgi:phosphate-selective porin OprO and OprP